MRSYLYVPAANTKLLKKAASLEVDGLIFDLEDSAAPDQKEKARQNLADTLSGDFKARKIMIRINGADSREYATDVTFVAACSKEGKIQGVVLPKVDAQSQVAALDISLEQQGADKDLELWAMIETPLGVLHADQLAASTPRLSGFILGLEDLSTKLGGISVNKDRSNIAYAMQRVVMAAKAYDMVAIDAVCTDYKSSEAMKASAEQSRDLGYDGKSLIHPSQIEIANEVFGVSKDELEHAHQVIDAFEAAMAKGDSVATMGGQLIESLHFEAAKQTALTFRAQNAG